MIYLIFSASEAEVNGKGFWSEVTRSWVDIDDATPTAFPEDLVNIKSRGNDHKSISYKETKKAKRLGCYNEYCDPGCPYLKPDIDPTSIEGECRLMNANLPWYDSYIAICSDTIERLTIFSRACYDSIAKR